MKHPHILPLLIIATLLHSPLLGQDPEDRTIRQVGITVEYFQLDHGVANQHVRDHLASGSSDATALHLALAAAVKARKAKSIASGFLVTRSGQRARIESVVEHIYPVSFDPPEVSQNLSGPIEDGAQVKTHLTAMEFRTRNTGLTLEVDPVLGSNNSMIDLNIATELVEHIGEKMWGQQEALLSQPVFNTIKNSTAVSSQDGAWALLGTHKSSPSMDELEGDQTEKSDERIIVLVRIDILKTQVGTPVPATANSSQIMITTMAEYFEVSASDAAEFLTEPISGKILRGKLDALVKTKAARLIDTVSLPTRSGQRARIESVNEWTYPTKMDSPEVPQQLAGPIAKGANIITPVSFTAFETRNIGSTMEIDPVASRDRQMIDINIAPEMVSLLGEKIQGQAEAQSKSPIFASLKTSTAVTVRSNEPRLISVYVPADKETRKLDHSKRIFLFLTASSLKVE